MSLSWQVLITVFTLGGIGAVVRALVLSLLEVSSIFVFPLGVLLINILAGFLGGFISAMVLPLELHIAFVIGFVGGMGTLSAICADAIDFYYDRPHRRVSTILLLVVYLVLTTVFGALASLGGLKLGGYLHDGSQATPMSLEEARQMELMRLQENLVEAEALGIGTEHEHDHTPVLPAEASAAMDSLGTTESTTPITAPATEPAPASAPTTDAAPDTTAAGTTRGEIE